VETVSQCGLSLTACMRLCVREGVIARDDRECRGNHRFLLLLLLLAFLFLSPRFLQPSTQLDSLAGRLESRGCMRRSPLHGANVGRDVL
jgi:hypothetical protein